MKLKTLIVSVLVLAALSAVVYFVRRPAPPAAADARLNQPLVDQATIEKAAKLRLSDQGKTVTIAREADGTWRVADYHGLPADFSKLSGFIGNLTDAKLQRLVTSNPQKLGRLEFKDTKVELLDSTDKPLWSVTLGKHAESGGGRYARFGDEQKAYLTDLNAWLDTDAKNWANTELLNLKADDIAKLEIPFTEGGPLTVSRTKKEEAWTADKTPSNQKLKTDKVSSALSSLASIRFSDTSNLDDPNVVAAKANLRTFKLTTFDNKTVTVALGRKPEEKKPKPPAPASEVKTDTAPNSAADASKSEEKKSDEAKDDGAKPETKSAEPEFETIPAGPVFAFITHSDAAAPVNALMQKRAFQVSDYVFTSLPQKPEELFEPAAEQPTTATVTPSPATAVPTESKSEEKK